MREHGSPGAGWTRRQFLRSAVGGPAVATAGCLGGSTSSPSTADGPRTITVSPAGSDSDSGAGDAQVQSLQAGLDTARPGDTVELAAGVHRGGGDRDGLVGQTKRAGTGDEPITITGPREAVVRGDPVAGSQQPLLDVRHSHVHVTGGTFDGLTDPSKPEVVEWYRSSVVQTSPPTNTDDYLTDVRIEPHAVGNSRQKVVRTVRTNDLQIGGFELVGPAGVAYMIGERDGFALGEVVGLGRSANNIDTEWYPWNEPDQSSTIRVHHVANLDGHWHTELVKAEPGVHDLTVEYCTDRGGSGRERGNGASVTLMGAQSTVRWCAIEGGTADGVSILATHRRYEDAFEDIPAERFPGYHNAVYGNRFRNIAGSAVFLPERDVLLPNGPDFQRAICGNDVDGETQANADQSCPDDVPTSEEIGHTAGDSSGD